MTVRSTITHLMSEVDRTEAAQVEWEHADYVARAAFAHMRLDILDRLAEDLTDSDLFDGAYAVWDDYIDGRRADERFEPLTSSTLSEQASIFARALRYLTFGKDALGLARAAWGTERFEVYTRKTSGEKTGKLAYVNGALSVRWIGSNPRVLDLSFNGQSVYASLRPLTEEQSRSLGLHPVFGRADS